MEVPQMINKDYGSNPANVMARRDNKISGQKKPNSVQHHSCSAEKLRARK